VVVVQLFHTPNQSPSLAPAEQPPRRHAAAPKSGSACQAKEKSEAVSEDSSCSAHASEKCQVTLNTRLCHVAGVMREVSV